MADFGSPVIDPKGNDIAGKTLQTLSGVLGLQEQKANIQRAQAAAQQETQSAKQRAGIADFFNNYDFTKHVGADGTIDIDQVLMDDKLRKEAGDQYPEVIHNIIAAKQGQLQAKQSLVNLNNDLRTQLMGAVGSMRTDPDVIADNPIGREKISRIFGQFSALGPDAARVAQIYGTQLNNLPKGQLSRAVNNFQLQGMDASTQAGRQAPSYADTGAALVNVNPQAAGGNIGNTPNLGKGISPGMNTFQDQAGNVWAFNPQNPGQATMVGQGGRVPTGGGMAPQPSAQTQAISQQANQGSQPASPMVPARPSVAIPGQEGIQSDIDMVRHSTQNIGTDRAINNRILNLLPETNTGFGSDIKARLLSAANLPGSSSLQELSAFLDRQAAVAGQSMGLPHTNAGMETSQQITGNISYDNKVIRDKTLFLDAMQAGAQAYRKGMDRTLGDQSNPNYGAYQQFRNAWSQAFRPEVFEWLNAKKRGDNAEVQRIEKDEGRKGMADLIQRGKILQRLTNGQ